MARPATLAARLEDAVAALAAAGIDTARADAEWLLAGLLGVGRAEVGLVAAGELPVELGERYAAAVRQRAGRVPLQQILGWEGFRGLRLCVSPDVLVPRPETEALAGWALELLPPARPGGRPLVIDVGTGSGCVALALARERSDVEVVATEVSFAAAVVAIRNARALGLDPRVRVVVTDVLAAIGGIAADLVVSNPPYLPSALLATLPPEVRCHEPVIAVDGGPDGLRVIRRLVGAARARLRRGGALVLETAGAEQAAEVAAILGASGFTAVATRRDPAGVERLVAGRGA